MGALVPDAIPGAPIDPPAVPAPPTAALVVADVPVPPAPGPAWTALARDKWGGALGWAIGAAKGGCGAVSDPTTPAVPMSVPAMVILVAVAAILAQAEAESETGVWRADEARGES